MAEACTTRYRARNPRATPLYRLFDTHFDEVKGQREERFERRCGFWRSFVDEHSAELLFRHKVIRLLQDEGLLTQERTELLLSWRHTGLSVHNRVRVDPEDRPAVERLARYIMRPPISLDRMAWDGVGEVQYRRKVGHERSGLLEREVRSFDAAEFLARVIMHLPEPRRHLVRYYGGGTPTCRGAGAEKKSRSMRALWRRALPFRPAPIATKPATLAHCGGAGRS